MEDTENISDPGQNPIPYIGTPTIGVVYEEECQELSKILIHTRNLTTPELYPINGIHPMYELFTSKPRYKYPDTF